MAEGPSGDRTEKATPKRRDEARRKGQVARSLEVNGALILLMGVSVLLLSSGHFAAHLGRNAAYLFAQAHLLRADSLGSLRELIVANLKLLLTVLAPLMGAVLLAGLAANVMQVGLRASAEALAFKAEKLNPIKGLKRFFSKRAAFDLLKNVFKIGLIALLAFATIRGELAAMLSTPLLPLPLISTVGKLAFAKLMFKLLAFLGVLAVIDWAFQRHQHEEKLKMTRAETKQEMKDTEGDPQLKARVRAIQLETARNRMLTDVPRADVVVTNPEHLAIALKYTAGDVAPRVLAKGRNHLAEFIKKIARRSRIPVIENKPVARALYPRVKVGGLVPENLYQVVAEILAYVYRLRKA